MALSDLENSDPEESNPNSSNANNGAAEQKQHKNREQSIVNREYFGGLHKNPVDRVENINMPKNIPTAVFAD